MAHSSGSQASFTLNGSGFNAGRDINVHVSSQWNGKTRACYGNEFVANHTAVGKGGPLDWLNPLDFDAYYHDALERHTEGTCQWFLNSPRFIAWLTGGCHILWCPGIGKASTVSRPSLADATEAGAGKTVLS